MNTSLNSLGYDIYEIHANAWILHTKGGEVFADTYQNVVRHALSLGFDSVELEDGVSEMVKKGHNAAHFGMHKGFIFTFKREFKSVQKAS